LNIQRQIPAGSGETLPHNIEAEQCLLGAILVNNGAYAVAEPLVAADDFFEPVHGEIFGICASLIAAGKLAATPITLKTFLPADLDIAGMKPIQYLARLAAEATTIINAPDYARIIRDLADRRRMIVVAGDFTGALRAAPVDMSPNEIAAGAIERLDEIATGQVPHTLRAVSIDDAGREALERLSAVMQGNGGANGMTWGLTDIDRRTDGIHRGELSILAGRPGMCKSGLGVHVALSAGADGHRVLYWSGEMTAEALGQRALTAIAYKISGKRIAYSNLRTGRDVTDEDFYSLRDAKDRFAALPISIDPQPNLTIAQIAMRARRRKQKEGLDLLILDHLHKIRAADRYRGDPTAETGEISNAIASLAKELNIGVLALCQLNRKTEERDDKRAQLSDLRQSGSLEQDADIVLFPYREAYYLLAREPAPGTVEHVTWEDKLADCKDRLEINIAKQRQGATGSVNCFTAIECNVFYSEAPDDLDAERRAGLAA
jgi:replicative DNA helicase